VQLPEEDSGNPRNDDSQSLKSSGRGFSKNDPFPKYSTQTFHDEKEWIEMSVRNYTFQKIHMERLRNLILYKLESYVDIMTPDLNGDDFDQFIKWSFSQLELLKVPVSNDSTVVRKVRSETEKFKNISGVIEERLKSRKLTKKDFFNKRNSFNFVPVEKKDIFELDEPILVKRMSDSDMKNTKVVESFPPPRKKPKGDMTGIISEKEDPFLLNNEKLIFYTMKREGDEIDRLDGMINCASVRALLTELIVSFDEELINIVLLTSSYIIQPYRFLQTLIVFYRGGKLTYPKKKNKK